MSFTLADAIVVFKGDDSPLSGALDKTKGALSNWGGAATKIIGGAVLGGATIAAGAIAAIGTAAFDVSKDTQRAAADMAASLGIPIEEANKFAEVAKQVYGNNFADDVGDAAKAVETLARTMGLAADDASLKGLTEDAFRLRDAFGVDVADSVDAAKTLMDNFGISGDEAFNMLAAGYQKGLDRSGDFLDTVGEYSVQFAAGGASAEQFFGLLDSGLQGGMLGTDKAADAFKEFRVRIGDGSKTTADALAQIGINVEDLTVGMANGTITAADAFTLVQDALNATTDPVTRMQAGVGLLGTQYEDLGDKAANALTLNNDWAVGTEGAIDKIDQKYTTFGDAMSAMWRRLVVSISPFTDKLLELVNDATPQVIAAFDALDANIGPIMENVQRVITTVVDFVMGAFAGFKESSDTNLVGPMAYWQTWVAENMPRIQTIITAVLGAIQSFWAEWGDEIMAVVGFVFGTIGTLIGTAMQNIGDVITLFLQLLTGDWEGAGETLKGIVQRTWDAVTGIFTTAVAGIWTAVTSIDWPGAGMAIVNGLWAGIQGAWEWGVAEPFRRKLDALRNLLPFSEPKDASSPLRGLAKSGASLVKMFGGGMNSEFDKLSTDFTVGLDGMMGGALSPQMAGGITVNQTFNGAVDPVAVGKETTGAIIDAGRRMGLR